MKFVINKCFGGFSLSQKAFQWLIDNKGWEVVGDDVDVDNMYHNDCEELIKKGFKLYNIGSSFVGPICFLGDESDLIFRSNSDVVEVVEKLGVKANGRYADLKIVAADLPIGQLEIDDYDGNETLQSIPKRF